MIAAVSGILVLTMALYAKGGNKSSKTELFIANTEALSRTESDDEPCKVAIGWCRVGTDNYQGSMPNATTFF